MSLMDVRSMMCCGVAEVDGISDYAQPADAMRDIVCDERWDPATEKDVYVLDIPEVAHIIFTQASRRTAKVGYGYQLARYIKRHGLGTVVVSQPAKNPNTSNQVHVFIWTLDEAGITQWAKKQGFRT